MYEILANQIIRSRLDAREFSGEKWITRFPVSRSTSDVRCPFRGCVESFVNALTLAGANVMINSTLRDRRRAFLMHWSWRIAKADVDPRFVPTMEGANIRWAHLDHAGNFNRIASIMAARAMVKAFGMERLGVAPSLTSRHLSGSAIDMSISWNGVLKIRDSHGHLFSIATPPWTGMNKQLHITAKVMVSSNITAAGKMNLIGRIMVPDERLHKSPCCCHPPRQSVSACC